MIIAPHLGRVRTIFHWEKDASANEINEELTGYLTDKFQILKDDSALNFLHKFLRQTGIVNQIFTVKFVIFEPSRQIWRFQFVFDIEKTSQTISIQKMYLKMR